MRFIGFLLVGSCLVAPAQSSLPDAPTPKPLVYTIGKDVTSPKVIFAVAPEFTKEASKHRVQGTVILPWSSMSRVFRNR